jgi:hypothetical protein
MPRELIGMAVFALVCILISPFYKNLNFIEVPKNEVTPDTHIVVHENKRTSHPKSIVLLTSKFLPTTFAGSEISAYETIKYLRERGHTVQIIVETWEVPMYDGFKIHKYDKRSADCMKALQSCDMIFFQMGDHAKNLEILEESKKPVYVFIHLTQGYPWLLQDKASFPLTIVYNSHMTQDSMPTMHKNMRMIPYVDTRMFKPLRSYTVQNNVVCLINCNKNKGGELFRDLAYKMPNVQFLGVKGGYSDQVIEDSTVANLSYIDTQKDMTKVFKRIGILLMPSRLETWGRTAVEAMASGVPVIHSEAEGLVECVGGAGVICNRYDEDAWVDAIRRIIGDRAYREHLRQNGFRRVEEIELEQRRGRNELAGMIEVSKD